MGVLTSSVLATVLISASTGTVTPAVPQGTVVFAGDVVAHATLMHSFQEHGSGSLLDPISPVLRGADLALCNLETPVSDAHPVTLTGVRFNAHADFARALRDAGVDAVSVANNHSFDMGINAVGDTLNSLAGANVVPVGAVPPQTDPLAPRELPLMGRTLCVFAATRILNYDLAPRTRDQPRVALARPSLAREQNALLDSIRSHRAHCGAIIVSLHTGSEYGNQPDPGDPTYFRRVAEAGADIVIGHHSHTPHPVEVVETQSGKKVPLFYSLGNLVSNQGKDVDAGLPFVNARTGDVGRDWRTRIGLLAVMKFDADGATGLKLSEFGYVPVWTINTAVHTARGAIPTISTALMPDAGGADTLLQQVWTDTIARVGAAHLLAATSVPGAVDAHRTGDVLVFDNRNLSVAEITARNQRAAEARAARHRR